MRCVTLSLTRVRVVLGRRWCYDMNHVCATVCSALQITSVRELARHTAFQCAPGAMYATVLDWYGVHYTAKPHLLQNRQTRVVGIQSIGINIIPNLRDLSTTAAV